MYHSSGLLVSLCETLKYKLSSKIYGGILQTSSHYRIVGQFFGCQKSSGRVLFFFGIFFARIDNFPQPVLHFSVKKFNFYNHTLSLSLCVVYTYEASIEVSPIIRSFIRIKSALDGFPLTVGEVAFGDEQHSAPDTVICTDEIPSQT